MRKPLIYLTSFVISFMIIYTIYYYKNIPYQTSSMSADASELKHTIISACPVVQLNDEELNIVFTPGFKSASLNFSSLAPDSFSFSYSGPVNMHILDSLDGRITNKIPHHPPLTFQELKEGQEICFSYLFRRLKMPKAFIEPQDKIRFKGILYRSLAYQFAKDNNISFLIMLLISHYVTHFSLCKMRTFI